MKCYCQNIQTSQPVMLKKIRNILNPNIQLRFNISDFPENLKKSENKEKALKSKDFSAFCWSECRDSNSRPLEPHSSAIPNFATPGYFVAVF